MYLKSVPQVVKIHRMRQVKTEYKDYGFEDAAASHMHAHFMPEVFRLAGVLSKSTRVLDVGCGNGYLAGEFLQRGCTVVGIDLSEKGVEIARRNYPAGRFEVMPAGGGILELLKCDPFDIIVSTEVVEHLYSPREYVSGCFDALRPGGRFVCTTPYHGYLKNLLLSILAKWDSHADPLWDGGHIKLWSRKTLSRLLKEVGFVDISFCGAGRVPYLWMTMVLSGIKPTEAQPVK